MHSAHLLALSVYEEVSVKLDRIAKHRPTTLSHSYPGEVN